MDKIKAVFIAIFAALSAWLGILAIPVLLLVGANIVDYVTGLFAAKYRGQAVSSYKSFKGIAKKINMWLLVGVGAMIDCLLDFASANIGISIHFGFLIACAVAAWLIFNELISILENVRDIGTPLPPFLLKLITYLKGKVENKVDSQIPTPDSDDIKKS